MSIFGGGYANSVGIGGGFFPGQLTSGGVGGGAATGKYSVLQNGLVAGGAAGNAAALALLATTIPASGGTAYWPAGTYRIDGNVTTPATVTHEFAPGAVLVIDAGKTLTINGPMIDGGVQRFSGAGVVQLAKAAAFVRPEWWGALGDGVADDSAAWAATITAAAPWGLTVLGRPHATYKAVGLVLRSNQATVIDGQYCKFVIRDASAPLLTVYGMLHQIIRVNVEQVNAADHCQGIVFTNDATTPITMYCLLRDLHLYSVYQGITDTMLALAGAGCAFRQFFENCIVENYTQQKTWAGSYGVKLDGDQNGNAGGNDTKLSRCLVKGYERNLIIRNSSQPVLDNCSIDGGAVAISYDAGSGLTLIGGYIEYNDTVFELLNTPYRLILIGPSVANYTTFRTGTLLNGDPITGYDAFGNLAGRVPIMGGDDGTGTGVTRFTGVNEVSLAIGLSLDKVMRWLYDGARYVIDFIIPDASEVWIKLLSTRKFRVGDPAANYMGWDVQTSTFITSAGQIAMSADGSLKIYRNNGNPNGAVTAAPGSLVINTAGGAGATLWVKESGTGNTGWVAK